MLELKEFRAERRDDGLFNVVVKYDGELSDLKRGGYGEHVTKVNDELKMEGVNLADICTYIPTEDRNITPLYFIMNSLGDIKD